MSHELRELALFKNVFTSHSNNIIQYLQKKDIDSLRNTNKFIYDICECHFLLSDSINRLSKLFSSSIIHSSNKETNKQTVNIEKKSKFKEKYNFNKSIDEYYKGSYIYEKRIQSARKSNK